jgi:hypothetical protein
MSDINLISQLNKGFVGFSEHIQLSSYPADLMQTPGLTSYALYSQYFPLHGARTTIGDAYCTEKRLDPTAGGTDLVVNDDATSVPEIKPKDPVPPEQVGHGKTTPVPYSDETMKEVMEKMKHPVFNVNTFVPENKIEEPKTDKKRKGQAQKLGKGKKQKIEKYMEWY